MKSIRNKIRQNNKIVISFSLYGNVNKYIAGLLENCRDINRIFPNFWIYVYIGNDFDHIILNEKFDSIQNLKFIYTNKSGHVNMSYRFTTIDEPDVYIAFSRDTDSRINNRDRYCINEFITSNKKFQIIRDHPEHHVRILGGAWGIKKGLLKIKIYDLLMNYAQHHNMEFGDDQEFLSKYLYYKIREDALIFDDLHLYKDENVVTIKTGRETLFGKPDFVGNRVMPVNLNDPFGPHGEWYSV
jgi:hypothetical protein